MWNSEKQEDARRLVPPRIFLHRPVFRREICLTAPYASKKGRAPKVLEESLLRDTTYGKANEEQFAVVRKPENFIVPGVRGYDVRADYEEMDDGR